MCYYFQGMLVMMYKSFYLESYCDINRAKQPLIVECSDDKDLYKSRNHDEKIMMWINQSIRYFRRKEFLILVLECGT